MKSKNITIDTNSPRGQFVEELLQILDAYEDEIIIQHRLDIIQAAQARGVRYGRRPKMDEQSVTEAIELKDASCTNNEVAKEFNVGRSTLLRYVAKHKAS